MSGQRPVTCPKSHPEYCLYAAETILPLLSRLETELHGVVKDDDIEYVHQSRVATRRIRAAFHIFSECFPFDQYAKWDRQIRRLTRSLGEARDLDVQIAFVQSFLSEKLQSTSDIQTLFSPSLPPVPAPETITTAVVIVPEITQKPVRSLTSLFIGWIETTRSFLHHGEKAHNHISESSSSQELMVSPGESAQVMKPGLECLLLRLIRRRQVMQKDIAQVASRCIEKKTIEGIARALHGLKVSSLLQCTESRPRYMYEQAFYQVMIRVAELFWFEPSLADPGLIEQHHAMRIAAKRLRYTLESYSGIFDEHLKAEIKVVKKIQEILGDIHDCDVWIDYLPCFLHEEKKQSEAYFGNLNIFSLVLPGITLLTEDRMNTRKELFQDLGVYWNHLKKERFWDDLTSTFSTPARGFCSSEDSSGKAEPLKIALISDIHANLPALEAVLHDAELRGARLLLNAGDIIGYGPFPDEVITLLRSRHILSVIGNYDLSILSKKWKVKGGSSQKRLAMRWAYHNISKDNRSWLKNLPKSLHLPIRNLSLFITHGSPESLTEYLDDGTPDIRMKEIAQRYPVDILVSGHSHRPAARQINGVWFINAGSVGRSEDGDPRACYALLQLDPYSLVHIRVPYEIERTIAALSHHHLPDSFSRIMKEGKPLEVVSNPDDRE